MGQVISFLDEDLDRIQTPHDDSLVITVRIGNYDVKRVLVDGGSLADILFYEPFLKMGIDAERLKKVDVPLYGFTGAARPVEGSIESPLMAEMGERQKMVMTTFLVVKVPSMYNAILGRPSLNQLQAIASTYYMKMKFPTEHRVGECRGDQVTSR